MRIDSAIHEAGHAVAAIKLGGDVFRVSVVETPAAYGRTLIKCSPGTHVVVALAGPAAAMKYSAKTIWHHDFNSDIEHCCRELGVRSLHELIHNPTFNRELRHAKCLIDNASDELLELAMALGKKKWLTRRAVHGIVNKSASKKYPSDTFQSRSQPTQPVG